MRDLLDDAGYIETIIRSQIGGAISEEILARLRGELYPYIKFYPFGITRIEQQYMSRPPGWYLVFGLDHQGNPDANGPMDKNAAQQLLNHYWQDKADKKLSPV